MAHIIVRDSLLKKTGEDNGMVFTGNMYEIVTILDVQCPDESFDEVWADCMKKNLIPERGHD